MSFPYRLSRILLAQLSLRVGDVVVMVRRVGLVTLGGELIGDRALILRIKVLVATLDTLLVTLALVDDGLGLVALVAGLVERAVADAGLARAVGGLGCVGCHVGYLKLERDVKGC